jgi:hypothetical protein
MFGLGEKQCQEQNRGVRSGAGQTRCRMAPGLGERLPFRQEWPSRSAPPLRGRSEIEPEAEGPAATEHMYLHFRPASERSASADMCSTGRGPGLLGRFSLAIASLQPYSFSHP